MIHRDVFCFPAQHIVKLPCHGTTEGNFRFITSFSQYASAQMNTLRWNSVTIQIWNTQEVTFLAGTLLLFLFNLKPSWVSNNIHCKVWDEITNPFPNLNGASTTPLENIIRNHNLDFHLYADDTQLYISFKPCDSMSRQTAISQVEACIKDIKTWMTNNLLKLN